MSVSHHSAHLKQLDEPASPAPVSRNYAPPTRILFTGMCTENIVSYWSRARGARMEKGQERLTELDDKANCSHYKEANAHCLRDLDEFASISYKREC